jgi:MFS family permease
MSRLPTFQALDQPSYRRLWTAAWLWYTCRWMELVVLSWLVLQLTDSPVQVALVGVSRMLPMSLLGLVAGSVADRFSRTGVMLVAQCVNLLSTAALAVLIMAGMVEPWHAWTSIFLTGTAYTMDFSTRRAYYAEIFPGPRLANAVALDTVALMGSSLIGPLVGGLLISYTGFGGAYAALVGMFLAGLLLLVTVHRGRGPREPSRGAGVAVQVFEALRAIRSNRALWATLLVTVCLNFFGSPYFQMVPVIARDILHAGSVRYGLLGAAAGLGAFGGSLAIASRRVRRKGRVYVLGAALMMGAIVLFATSPYYLLSLALLVLVGAGLAGFATMQPTLALEAVTPDFRGRALGAVALGIGAGPLGTLLAGNMAEGMGAPRALAMLSGVGFILVLALYAWLPELRARSR